MRRSLTSVEGPGKEIEFRAATLAQRALTTNVSFAQAWLISMLPLLAPLLIFGVYPALLLNLANGTVTTLARVFVR